MFFCKAANSPGVFRDCVGQGSEFPISSFLRCESRGCSDYPEIFPQEGPIGRYAVCRRALHADTALTPDVFKPVYFPRALSVRGGRALALASPPLAARVQCRCAPRRELRAAAPKACHGRARRVRTTSAARSYRRAWASAFINRASARRNHRGAKGWLPALLVLATIGKCSATEPFFPPPRSVEETSASLSRRTAPGRSSAIFTTRRSRDDDHRPSCSARMRRDGAPPTSQS